MSSSPPPGNAGRDVGDNGGLAAGASATFGFIGSRLGSNGGPTLSCATTT